jgi:ElaB/YqjD/DUF883 family membrane-anchored ribosome-binding protein
MPATKAKKQAQTIISIDEFRNRVGQMRQDVEEAVETIGRRAAEYLPETQRQQVDEVIDRFTEVRDDMNKAVGSWRTDVEKQFGVIRGTVDKRVTAIRKETESRRKKAVTGFEKEARKYTKQVFKRLQLPVRSDLDAIKRRLIALERRLTAIEKSSTKAAA